jgi:hypothetical protein
MFDVALGYHPSAKKAKEARPPGERDENAWDKVNGELSSTSLHIGM